MEYNIKIKKENVHPLLKALDLHARIGLGQFEEIAPATTYMGMECSDPNRLYVLLNEIKSLFGHEPNSSHGICNPSIPDAAKLNYDLLCVIRKVVAEEESHENFSVWHREPLHVAKEVPLAKVTVNE